MYYLKQNAILESLKPLFEKAEKEGLWFYCSYHELWISPTDLKKAQGNARYSWGPLNWDLKHPSERTKIFEEKVEQAKENLEDWKRQI